MHKDFMCLHSMNTAASAIGSPSDARKYQVLRSITQDQTKLINTLMHSFYCTLFIYDFIWKSQGMI